jgi:phage shock protein A|tara:strand:+ start:237 stop:461 length:225 start_codon:yes stop_codon:yes gene_type:complete
MGIFRKINNLLAKKQKIEKEIAILQKSCKHFKKSVRQVRKNVDSTSPSIRYVCDECLMVLGYPTQQEKDDFLKE